MGRSQFLDWAFTAPRAGDYVLTIGVNIARIEQERVGELSVQLDGVWKAYGTLAQSGLALARHWPEHGGVALRTGWNDPHGILLALECGAYGSHGTHAIGFYQRK